jgi:hypothetical protein
LVEVQDPLYTIRKYADEEELLYCPFEGLVAATAPVNGRKKSSNASAYFNHLHWGLERPSFLNREAEGREDIWQGSNSNDLLMGGNMVFFGLPWLSPDGIINFHGAETSDNMRDPKSYVFKNDKDKDDIEFYGKNYPKYDFNLGFDDEDEDTNPTNERMKIKCSTGYRSNITDYLSLQAY